MPVPGTGPVRRTFLKRAAVAAVAVVGGSLTSRRSAAAHLSVGEPEGSSTRRGPEPYIGEIIAVPYTFPPRGFAFCEGQTVPIASNQSLFSLIGVNYGGDGRSTFNLPDTRPAEAAAQKAARADRPPFRYAIAVGVGVYPSRA